MRHNALRDAVWSARLAEERARFERAERRRRLKVLSVIIGAVVLVVVGILIADPRPLPSSAAIFLVR